MSEDKNRKRDTYSELLIATQPDATSARLFDEIENRIATHHYNRCVVKVLDVVSGTLRTFNIYLGDGDPAEFQRRRDQLNWTEH
jgi:hypothetical protein